MAPRRKRGGPPKAPSLKRKLGSRSVAHHVWIGCEGKTEKDYLDHLAQRFRRPEVNVQVMGQRGVPKTVVREACRELYRLREQARRSGGEFEVWAVCDRDEHGCFHDARARATHKGVGFAWSSPCVELWGLLHFANQTAGIHRHDCQRALHAAMPRYRHEKAPLFDHELLTDERRAQAHARAIHLHGRAADADDPWYNPTTTLWKLVKVIEHGNSTAARAAAIEVDDGSARWWLEDDPGA